MDLLTRDFLKCQISSDDEIDVVVELINLLKKQMSFKPTPSPSHTSSLISPSSHTSSHTSSTNIVSCFKSPPAMSFNISKFLYNERKYFSLNTLFRMKVHMKRDKRREKDRMVRRQMKAKSKVKGRKALPWIEKKAITWYDDDLPP